MTCVCVECRASISSEDVNIPLKRIYKRAFALTLGCLFACASMQAAATDDFNRTIDRFGIQFNSAFVVFKEPLSGPCSAVNLGSLDTQQTKAMYASLLAAKAADGKIYHIGYATNEDGTCSATSMELQ